MAETYRPFSELLKKKQQLSKDGEFVSHSDILNQEKTLYFAHQSFTIEDYTQGYLEHLAQKEERLRDRDRIAQEQQEEAPEPPKTSTMTNLMNLVNEPPPAEEESEDLLEDIRKDFISPYEKESVSTVMMPASELLEQARLEEEEDARAQDPYTFESIAPRDATKLYDELEQVFKDIVKEWDEQKSECDQKEACLAFEGTVVNKLNSIAAQAVKLPQKSESFIRNWIQQNIFRIVDGFFSFFSKIFASAYSGDMNAARVRNWIQEILFGRLQDIFTRLQWFSIEMILPLQSEFDHTGHTMITKQSAGPEFRNYIISIENAGLYSADESTRIRKAKVIVGS